jgi:hypothetical protein
VSAAPPRVGLTQALGPLRTIIATFSFLLLSGCSSAPNEAIAALFEHHDMHRGRYCLDMLGADPETELLTLSRKFNERVLPASQCRQNNPGYKSIDGQDVQMVRIVQIRRVSLSVVKIEVVDDSGFMLGSSGGTYTVERLSGYWIVTKYEQQWVS